MTDEGLLTVREVAERLRVHPDTVRQWLRAGRLHGRAFGGRTGYRIAERDLQAFLEAQPKKGKAVA